MLEKQTAQSNQKGKSLIIMGFACIGVLFLIYFSVQNQEITPDAMPVVERIAVGFYIIMILAFGAIGLGSLLFQHVKNFSAELNCIF